MSEAAQALKDKVMDDHFEPVEWDDIKGLHDTKQATECLGNRGPEGI